MYSLLKIASLAIAALPLVAAAGTGPRCNITQSVLAAEVPANQSAIIPPSNATLIQVTLGVGTQNYTCESGKFVNVGAKAEIFDISCLQPLSPIAAALPASVHALEIVDGQQLFDFLALLARVSGFKLADHYFDTSIGTLSPVFNFAVSGGGFVIGKKLADIPSPADPTVNVDWLLLQNVAGNAATFVVRELSAGGQPPSSCSTEGDTLQVPYAAKYWFFN